MCLLFVIHQIFNPLYHGQAREYPPPPLLSPPRTEFPLGKQSGIVKCNRKIENKNNTTPEKKRNILKLRTYCKESGHFREFLFFSTKSKSLGR